MTDVAAPAPATVPAAGVNLTINGFDTNGLPSQAGLTSPTITDTTPDTTFVLTVAADGFSATLVPNPGVVGSTTVTASCGTTNADGTPGATVTATYVGSVVPGNAVSIQLVATDITPPPPPAPGA